MYYMARTKSLSEVERLFREQIASLWPAALGSLSLRRTRCIRTKCHACETGEQHPSYVLYCPKNGRRSSLYIPDELAEPLRKALDNGKAIEKLLYEAGRLYAQALKREREQKST